MQLATGQLTAKGFEESVELGKMLKKKYIDDLKLISPAIDLSQVYVRSTNITRSVVVMMMVK